MPVKKIPTARATPAKAPRRNPRPVKTTAAPKPAPAASLKAKTGAGTETRPGPNSSPAAARGRRQDGSADQPPEHS
jgi:hypothetical protein